MPTGPSSSSYIIPPLTLSDTFYEWYKLTNDEIIDKLNRLKTYTITGATGVSASSSDDGNVVVYLANTIPGDHTFTGNITFDGTVTTVNTNLVTIDDYNLVLGAVGTGGTGGTNDTNITTAGGGGIIIAGSSGNKYFLWKQFESTGRTYSAWRISDALAFTGDAKFYSNNNTFSFIEGDDSTPASNLTIKPYSSGNTVDVQTYFGIYGSTGLTYTNFSFFKDGSSQLIDSCMVKRFMGVTGITAIGMTFGSVVRHDVASGGLTLALANTVYNAESLGIVVGLNTTTKTVDVGILGYVGGTFGSIATADGTSTLGTGEFYFLSDTEPGKITKTSPTTTDSVRKPILYALGSNRAMVMNYVGNKIVNIDSIYSKLNAATMIITHSADYFSVGDVVRFEEGITSSSQPYGSYIKASSDTPEQAEALGVISKINYGGTAGASLLTISGFIDLTGSGMTLSPGSVYYLGSEAGKLTTTVPTSSTSVRKPMLVAISPTTAVVQNYVGLVNTTDSSNGTSVSISNSGGFKNKLINGNFDFWQRGTTFSYKTTSDPNAYCADRWKLVNSGSSTPDKLSIQVNRVPLGLGVLPERNVDSKYALEFDIGTGGYSADSETYLFQRIEGIGQLPRGYATISFYAKATVANARLGVAFRRDFGGGTAPDYLTTGIEKNSQKLPGFVTSVPVEWKKFVYTFALPDTSGGVIGASGTDGPEIKFYIRAGSTYAGKDISEAMNPTIAGVNNYKIQIAQVQLEEGIAATPFQLNDPESEFARCQRYYQTSSSIVPYRNIAAGTSSPDNADGIPILVNQWSIRYPVEIRDPVTCSIALKDSVSSFSTFSSKGKKGFRLSRGSAANSIIQYEVDSEL